MNENIIYTIKTVTNKTQKNDCLCDIITLVC